MVFFKPAILSKETPTQAFSCEHCKIFKNTCFEKHLQTAASNSGYILHKKLSKIIQEPDWPSFSFSDINSLYFTYFYSLSLAVICCHSLPFFATRCHLLYSLSFIVTRCHSLSFAITHCTTRCHSLSLVVPLVVIRCTTRLPFYKRSSSAVYILFHKISKMIKFY